MGSARTGSNPVGVDFSRAFEMRVRSKIELSRVL